MGGSDKPSVADMAKRVKKPAAKSSMVTQKVLDVDKDKKVLEMVSSTAAKVYACIATESPSTIGEFIGAKGVPAGHPCS